MATATRKTKPFSKVIDTKLDSKRTSFQIEGVVTGRLEDLKEWAANLEWALDDYDLRGTVAIKELIELKD